MYGHKSVSTRLSLGLVTFSVSVQLVCPRSTKVSVLKTEAKQYSVEIFFPREIYFQVVIVNFIIVFLPD